MRLRTPTPSAFHISHQWVIRGLVVLVVALALAAGYYQQDASAEYKRYKRLEDVYVRVRQQLGVEATQKLIDQSYQTDNTN